VFIGGHRGGRPGFVFLRVYGTTLAIMRPLIAVAIFVASAAAAIDIDPQKVVDLTYPFDGSTIYWPTAKHFTLDSVAKGDTPGGYWYEANNYCAAEHGGTHMDAPVHFAKGGASSDQVPPTAGIGPLVKVDVSAAAAQNADYRLTRADLEAWERAHGRIPRGAIVVMFSGWGARWPDA
jgi:kynurenine formamidase